MKIRSYLALATIAALAPLSLGAAAHADSSVDSAAVDAAASHDVVYLDDASSRLKGNAISSGMGELDVSGTGELFLLLRVDFPSGSFEQLKLEGSGFSVPEPGETGQAFVEGSLQFHHSSGILAQPVSIVMITNHGDSYTVRPVGVADTAAVLR